MHFGIELAKLLSNNLPLNIKDFGVQLRSFSHPWIASDFRQALSSVP